MRQTKREPMWYEFYQDADIAEHLEKMAARGWRLEKTGNLWRYRRAEPAQLRYAVTYFSEASEFNPGPTEYEETLREYCAAAGWDFVAGWHQMLIFSTGRGDAPSIETEGAVKLEAVHRAMKKNFLPGNFTLLALFGFNLVMQLRAAALHWPRFLADGVQLGAALLMLALAGHFASSLISYFLWRRAAKRSVERGEPCPARRSRFGRARQILLLAAALAVLFLMYIPATLRYGRGLPAMLLLFLCGYGLVTAAVMGLRGWLKRRKAGAGFNRAATFAAALILSLGLAVVIPFLLFHTGGDVWGTKAETEVYVTSHGSEWTLRRDPLPLKIEDLRPIEDGPRSYEMTERWSPLARLREGRQVEYEDWESLYYELLDVKTGFLYRVCLDDYVGTEEFYGSLREYRAEDAAPWGAEAAWRQVLDGEARDVWVLCRDRRIVLVGFDRTPTAAQMALAGEKLLAGA